MGDTIIPFEKRERNSEKVQMSSPKERLEFAETLRLNVEECNYASRTAKPAKERLRINDPVVVFPEVPATTEFCSFMSSYADTAESQAAILKIIGNLLKQEQHFSEHDPRRQEQVNIVQTCSTDSATLDRSRRTSQASKYP